MNPDATFKKKDDWWITNGGLMLYFVNRTEQYDDTLPLSSPLKGKVEGEAAGSESKLFKKTNF